MHTNRLDRIKEEYGKPAEEFDWLRVRGVPGESQVMWLFFKERITLRRGVNGKPNLHEWGQRIYDQYIPCEYKTRSAKPNVMFMTCQSAARDGNDFAKMVVTLLRWIDRQPQMGIRGNRDVIMWLEAAR